MHAAIFWHIQVYVLHLIIENLEAGVGVNQKLSIKLVPFYVSGYFTL